MKCTRLLCLGMLLWAFIAVPSCGGDSGGGGTGTLSVGLMDASTDDYKAVYVSIGEVQVYLSADTWKVVGRPNKTYNLLDLINGVSEELAIAELEAGNYIQMRLVTAETPDGGLNIMGKQHPYANYTIGLDDTVHELRLPSSLQGGVKIFRAFTISSNKTTELFLDFNISQSVVVGGNSGMWLLKPTIKVLSPEEGAIIGGAVIDGDSKPLSGVSVSAQINDTSASDIKDLVVIETSTFSDEGGQYNMLIKPGTYNIVAYRWGYYPAVQCAVPLTARQVSGNYDFALPSAPTGTVSGTVIITNAKPDEYVTISFKQFVDCGGTEPRMEIKSLNVINGGNYSTKLPVGFYDTVASTKGKDSIIIVDVGVREDGITDLPITM
jgi:Domain of unknown function (DUF4382)/Carboxypeptidase regulatory-like domain